MPNDHIDEAFVDIKPDVKDFDRDLKRELDASFRSVEAKLDEVVDRIENSFERLIHVLDIHFDNLTHSVDSAMDGIRHDAAHAAESIAVDFEAGTKVAKHAIDDLADDAGRDFARLRRKSNNDGRNVGDSFMRGLFSSLKDAGGQVSGAIGSALSGAGGALSSVFGGGGDIVGTLKIAAIAAAIPIVIALAGALSQLLGLLLLIPAAVGFLVAAIAPLIIAFKGFGEAVGAGLSGDVKKFDEALKGLAPSARAVVKEITAFSGPLKQLGKDIQQAFFAELVGQIKPFLKDVLPVLGRGLVFVAGSLSRFAAAFIELLHSNDILEDIKNLFTTTGTIINKLSPVLINLFGTLFGVMEHGLPFLEQAFDVIGRGIQSFADFLSNAMKSGDFVTWVQSAFRVVGELWDLLKAVGGLLKTLFVGTADSGEDFIIKLTEMINKLNDFFANTKEGKETIMVLAQTVKFLALAVLGLGVAFANVLRWINEFVHWLVEAWNWLKSVGSAIGSFFVSVGSAIASAWNATVSWISGAWTAIVNFFTSLPGKIMTAIQLLPTIIKEAFVRAIEGAAYYVGYGIGSIIAFFRDLPLKVWAILVDFWNGTVSIVSGLIDSVVNFFGQLPNRVANFVSAMKLRVVTLIVDTKNAFVSRVRELVDSATSTAASLPGRIWAAVKDLPSKFIQLGKDMINGMINGIESMAGRLVDAAKRIASKAWQGAKDAIGANSPSKEFAKLGKWSVQGFEMGMRDEADSGSKPPGFPDIFGGRGAPGAGGISMKSGGAQIVAYLQISDDQLHPVVVRAIEENPQTVALANESGDRYLSRRR